MTFFFDHDVPEDCAYALEAMGHKVVRLRNVLPTTASDDDVWQYSNRNGFVLVTCNREDFLPRVGDSGLAGLVILVRRHRRALERAALVQLIERVGESGLRGAIHFA